MKSKKLIATLTASALAFTTTHAFAYGEPGHHAITAAAYDSVRGAVAVGSVGQAMSVPPAGVSASDFKAFLDKLQDAHLWVGQQQSGAPGCRYIDGDKEIVIERDSYPGPDANDNFNPLVCQNDLHHGMRWGEKFNVVGDGQAAHRTVLGFQAKSRDDDLDETYISLGVLDPLEKLSEVLGTILGILLVPIFCLIDLFVDIGDCSGEALEVGDDIVFIDEVIEALDDSLFGHSEMFVGLWHLMNVDKPADITAYAGLEVTGYQPMLSGPGGQLGAVEAMLGVLSTTLLLRVDPSKSDGYHRYAKAHGIPVIGAASQAYWIPPFSTRTYPPLSDLAKQGYDNNFPVKGRRRPGLGRLSWPLHALGDATVPMHTVGTASWGHKPYENYVDRNLEKLLYIGDDSEGQAQAKRALDKAYFYYKKFAAKGASAVDEFVLAVARETQAGTNPSIYCDGCSAANGLEMIGVGLEDLTAYIAQQTPLGASEIPSVIADPSSYYNDYESEIRTNVERSMAAKIAFLVMAAEDAGLSCMDDDDPCFNHNDCCSDRCVTGKCFPPQELCRETGDSCSSGGDCCSNRCSHGQCLRACTADGNSCGAASECCAGECSGGVCGTAPACKENGVFCSIDAECCSSDCSNNVCRVVIN